MEQYDCNHCTSEQCSPQSLAQLFFDTQFADTVMLLSRQGASLKTLCESLRQQLRGTPLENKVEDLTKKLGEIERHYQATPAFASLDSEFALLEILKNRSGPVDKVAFAFHKSFGRFEPVEYQ
jgi:replicative DNA helicase